MATVTHLVSTPDTGNTPNTSGAFSPASGDLLVVFVTKEASALSSPMVSADLTSSVAPTSFTLIRTQGHRSSAAHMGVFVADALTTNTTSRTVTIASGSDAGAGTIIGVLAIAGMTKVGSNAVRGQGGQTDQAAGTPAPAFGAAALTGNPCVGAIYNGTNPATMTQPSGWSEGSDVGYTTGEVSGLETAFRNSGETGTTITWGSSSGSVFASIILELDVSNPISITTLAPTALTLATFAPTIATPIALTPDTLALALTTYAPTVAVAMVVTPDTLALTLSTFAPTIATPVALTPDVLSLTLSTFAPTVSTPIALTPSTLDLTLTTFAPSIATPVALTPDVLPLTLTTYAPTVATPIAITPDVLALAIVTYAPTVTAGAATEVIPDTIALVLTTYAPTVEIVSSITLTPGTVSLTLLMYAPLVTIYVPPIPDVVRDTYTGLPRLVTASRSAPGLVGSVFRKTRKDEL